MGEEVIDAEFLMHAGLTPLTAHEERPWEHYTPPTDPQTGLLTLSAKDEFDAGLRPTSLADRLQRNGIAEMALKTLVELAQDKEQPGKVRLEASKVLVTLAHGTPVQGQRPHDARVLVILDRPAALPALPAPEGPGEAQSA